MFSAIRVELHLISQDKTEFEKYSNLKTNIIYRKQAYLLFKIKPVTQTLTLQILNKYISQPQGNWTKTGNRSITSADTKAQLQVWKVSLIANNN